MSISVVVGKKWDAGAQYIGRPSPLGNPFKMRAEQDRDRVCDEYEVWFRERVEARDPEVIEELRRLYRIAKSQGHLVLGCYCAPRRCHGDVVAAFLRSQLST